MSDVGPPGPPGPKEGPKDIQKPKAHPQGAQPSGGEYKYLGFTFNSERARLEFKDKFLVRMANLMIRQIKSESDKACKALRKIREDNQ